MRGFHLILLSILLLTGCPLASIGQDNTNQYNRIDSLNKEAGKIGYHSANEQIEIGRNILKQAKTLGYSKGSYEATLNIGIGYLNLGVFDKALKYFQDANLLANKIDDYKIKSEAVYFLGNVHNYLDDSKKALKYFKEALSFCQLQNDETDPQEGIVLNSIGVVYYKSNNLEKAKEYFEKAYSFLKKNKHTDYIDIVMNNLGNIAYDAGDFHNAIDHYQQSYETALANKKNKRATIALQNIGLSYRELKQYNKAFDYLNKALSRAKEYKYLEVEMNTYKDMADTYKALNNEHEEFKYFKRYTALKDSIFSLEKSKTISRLQIKYETVKKEKEIIESQKMNLMLVRQHERNRLVIIGAAIILLFLIFTLILLYKKKKMSQKLWQSELKNKELEKEQLKAALNSKQIDLTNLSLDIKRKNDFFLQLYEELKSIEEHKDELNKNKKIRSLVLKTLTHLRINKSTEKLQLNIEKINATFFDKLHNVAPNLTTKEKQLCSYIKLNLNNKDIANLKNVSLKSVEMAKYRLRKKLSVPKNDDLSDFIRRL